MIEVYGLTAPEGMEWALPSIEADNTVFLHALGRPVADEWQPVQMDLIRTDEFGRARQAAELPWMGEHLLILKRRAVSVLGDLCLRAGELLPLRCAQAELVAWNVTTVADGLDEPECEGLRYPDGRFMSITRYRFKPHAVRGLTAFRVPRLRSHIFLGPEIVQCARNAGLQGTEFRRLWQMPD